MLHSVIHYAQLRTKWSWSQYFSFIVLITLVSFNFLFHSSTSTDYSSPWVFLWWQAGHDRGSVGHTRSLGCEMWSHRAMSRPTLPTVMPNLQAKTAITPILPSWRAKSKENNPLIFLNFCDNLVGKDWSVGSLTSVPDKWEFIFWTIPPCRSSHH